MQTQSLFSSSVWHTVLAYLGGNNASQFYAPGLIVLWKINMESDVDASLWSSSNASNIFKYLYGIKITGCLAAKLVAASQWGQSARVWVSGSPWWTAALILSQMDEEKKQNKWSSSGAKIWMLMLHHADGGISVQFLLETCKIVRKKLAMLSWGV